MRLVPLPNRGWQSAAGLGLAHPERFALGDHDGGVVEEAVEHGDGGGVVGQEASPLVEGPVAGQAQAPAFVGRGHEPEEELAAVGVEGGEAELIADDQVWAQQVVDDAADRVVGEASVEGLDEVGGGEVADPEAGLDGGVAESDQ